MEEQKNKQQEDTELMKEFCQCNCPYCGLDLDTHDGSGFCPGGTEEFGGRR